MANTKGISIHTPSNPVYLFTLYHYPVYPFTLPHHPVYLFTLQHDPVYLFTLLMTLNIHSHSVITKLIYLYAIMTLFIHSYFIMTQYIYSNWDVFMPGTHSSLSYLFWNLFNPHCESVAMIALVTEVPNNYLTTTIISATCIFVLEVVDFEC